MKLLESSLKSISTKEWNNMLSNNPTFPYHFSSKVRSFLEKARKYSWQKIESQKEVIYREVSVNSSFSVINWELLKSSVLEEIEQYWVVKSILDDKKRLRSLVIEIYEKRGLHKNLRTHINRYDKELELEKLSTERMERAYSLELTRYNYLSEVKREKELNINELLHSADVSFVINKLKLSCYALSHQQVVDKDYSLLLLDEVLELISIYNWTQNPLIKAFYHAVHLYRSEDKQRYHYSALKDTLHSTHEKIGPNELRDLTVLGINYSIKMYRKGEISMNDELLAWYEFGLSSSALLIDDQVSPYTYRNAATVALRANRADWAKNFTLKYRDTLPSSIQSDLFGFNMGRIYYREGAYNEARDFLFDINFEDTLLYLASKTLLLKIYFHINEYPLLDFTTDGLRAYIRRKKIAASHRQNYMRFTKYMKSLSRAFQGNPDKKKHKQLKLLKAIQEDKAFPEKEWFIQQLPQNSKI